MGNKQTKLVLKDKDVKRLSAATGFEPDEVKALYNQFASLKGSDAPAEDLMIDRTEFQSALGYRGASSVFLDRIFKLFDQNGDGLINFDEFITGIAVLTPSALIEKKMQFTFKIYDLDNRDRISRANLAALLGAALRENDVALTSAQIDKMVDDTFATQDANKDGYIDYEEYKSMCVKNRAILAPLTLNVSELIAQAKADAAPAGAGAGAGGK